MKNKFLIATLALLLVGCGKTNPSSETSGVSNNDTSDLTINETTNSIDVSNSNGETPSSNVNVGNDFNLENALNYLALANLMDEDFSSITISRYIIRESYYQTQSYKMTSYTNDLTIYKGTTTQTTFINEEKLSSNFQEQRLYKDGKYSQIRKFDSTFANSALIKEVEQDEADFYLGIGQSITAFSVLSSFSSNYNSNRFYGSIDASGNKHGIYFYQEQASDAGYCFTAAMEFTLDSDYYLTDFYYTEGYYDAYFCDDMESVRKHGPSSYGGGGNTFEVTRFEKEEKIEYTKSLPFSLEDNFITSLDFKTPELTISKSENKDGYINLLDYVTSNIEIGLTNGAPVNNLTFTSSNTSVATIGDQYYADFVGTGETFISAKDSTYNVTSSNTLKLIIVD